MTSETMVQGRRNTVLTAVIGTVLASFAGGVAAQWTSVSHGTGRQPGVLGFDAKEGHVSRTGESRLGFAVVLVVLELLIIASTFLPRFFLTFLFDVDMWGWLANVISVVFIVWMNAIMLWMVYRASKIHEEAPARGS